MGFFAYHSQADTPNKRKKMHQKKKHHTVEERKEVEEKEHTAQRKNGAEPDPRPALIWPATETHG